MSRTLYRLLFFHIILSALSGLWMATLAPPLLLIPCVAFYTMGPLHQIFRVPSTEIYTFQLLCIAGESAVVVCLLTWQSLAVLVHLPAKTKHYIKQFFLYHTAFVMIVIVSIYPIYKFFPTPIGPCFKAAGITNPNDAQLLTFILNPRDPKARFIVLVFLEGTLFYAFYGLSSCVILVYKLNEQRETSSRTNTSTQQTITTTLLILAGIEVLCVVLPIFIFLIEYLFELYDEIAIKMCILFFGVGHIIEPIALLFTLKSFREILFKCFRFGKKSRPVNKITMITMIKGTSTRF